MFLNQSSVQYEKDWAQYRTLRNSTDEQYLIVDRLGAFFHWTRFIWQQCTVRQYHSDLSNQSVTFRKIRGR